MAPGQKLEDQLSVTVGRIASILYVRDVSGEEPRVIRGGIGVGLEPGETPPMQETGVAANINLAHVDLDAWQKLLTGLLRQQRAFCASASGGHRRNQPCSSHCLADLHAHHDGHTRQGAGD